MQIIWFTLFAVAITTLVVRFYRNSKKKHSYWSSRSVPGPKPWPLLGNLREVLLCEPGQIQLELTRKFGKLYGHYAGYQPVLRISDPELIKQIMVKDFDKFINRRTIMLHDDIWDLNLFQLENERWKTVRSITSPTFTSGKLRGMFPLMNRTIDKLIQYLDKVSDSDDDNRVINVKDVMAGFSMDTIALAAFATETNTNNGERPAKRSLFLEQAKKFFEFSIAKIMFVVFAPKFLLRWFNVTMFFNQTTFKFFVTICRKILKERTTNRTVKQNDLVQLLLDASVSETELTTATGYDQLTASEGNDTEVESESKSNEITAISKRKLTENELIAQCIIFLLAGYETTASTISYLLYELALNQEIQNRLSKDVRLALEQFDDDDNQNSREYYDVVINGIGYLEATIKETLRKYPPATMVERRVSGTTTDDYRLGGVELFKDQVIEVMIYSVHHSDEYYPEPERFKPERFMPENRHLLVPYTYLPFGVGPRNCVGMRFAYQEMKLLLAQLLLRYRFEATPETPIPLRFEKGAGLLTVKSIPIKIFKR